RDFLLRGHRKGLGDPAAGPENPVRVVGLLARLALPVVEDEAHRPGIVAAVDLDRLLPRAEKPDRARGRGDAPGDLAEGRRGGRAGARREDDRPENEGNPLFLVHSRTEMLLRLALRVKPPVEDGPGTPIGGSRASAPAREAPRAPRPARPPSSRSAPSRPPSA